jgi:ABC-2 type transport system ATP-binding protein
MIRFTEVRKTFGLRTSRRVDALSSVTFEVGEAESVAVVGPNGAGKSTLLALILGFLRPTYGEIAVGGLGPRDWVRKHGAGWLPERFELPPEWTTGGALRALASLEGGRSDSRGLVDVTLERFGLDRHDHTPVGSLSRGMLQRLGLAQAVIAHRSLVILDEPTNGLDPDGRRLFRETVAELRAGGATMLIASHDLAELERTTDRAIVLEAGSVRDIIDVTSPGAAGVYTIRASGPESVLRDAFPGATRLDDGEAAGVRWAVTVADALDLNRRLARLIAAGALLHEVSPAAQSLEDRIRGPAVSGAGDE